MELSRTINWNDWSLDRLYNGYYNILNHNFGNGYNTSNDVLRKNIHKIFFENLPGIGHITHQEKLFAEHIKYNCWRAIKYTSNNIPQPEPNPPLNISGCSYPPLEKCLIQRCSFAGEQVFYGGEHPLQIFHEMDWQKGDRFVIGNWELRMTDYQVFLFYTAGVQNIQFANNMVNKFFEELRANISTEHFILYKHWMNISTSLLLSHNRMVSAWISQELLKKENTILTYPSLKFHGLNNNVAIPAKIVDSSNMKLNKVMYCEVEKWQYHQRISRVLMDGTIDHSNGSIKWSTVDGAPYLIDPESSRIFDSGKLTPQPI
jgi:hypothetical protein